MHALSSSILGFSAVWGFLWLMAILLRDFGKPVIPLFMSGVGNIVLAFMTIVDIANTWKPLVLIAGGCGIAFLLSAIGL